MSDANVDAVEMNDQVIAFLHEAAEYVEPQELTPLDWAVLRYVYLRRPAYDVAVAFRGPDAVVSTPDHETPDYKALESTKAALTWPIRGAARLGVRGEPIKGSVIDGFRHLGVPEHYLMHVTVALWRLGMRDDEGIP